MNAQTPSTISGGSFIDDEVVSLNGNNHEITNEADLLQYHQADQDEEDDEYVDTATDDSDSEFGNATIDKSLSKNNANSFIGGSSVKSKSNKHKESSHKIFSFSLPFGNLSVMANNLSKQLSSFNLNSPLSSTFSSNNEKSYDSIDKQKLNLKLSKQESITTLEEEYLFRNFKGIDSSRLRAVKRAITPSINYGLKKRKPNWESVFDEIDGNIVVLGGYRGSVLRDAKTHKRIWIPIKAGFNLRKINLLLGPNPEDEINASKYIYPDGILKNIGPVDICKKILKKLDNGKTNVKEYGYDWRLSASLNSKNFEAYLTEIYERTGKPVLVIGHSMGGIIAHSVLNRSPHLFRSIIYVGVPSECPNILGPIRFGDNVLLSSKILTPEVNFMMRSSYIFLPLNGRLFIDSKTKKRIDLDFFDADTWVEYNLNPVVSKGRKLREENKRLSEAKEDESDESKEDKLKQQIEKNDEEHDLLNRLKTIKNKTFTDTINLKSFNLSSTHLTSTQTTEDQEEPYHASFTECYDYLKATLKDTKEFLEALDYKPELKYPPLAIVYGKTVPSVRGCKIDNLDDIREGRYFNFFYGHGDGVIHQKWLLPERRGFSVVGKFSSECGHVSLMTDLKAMGSALSSVLVAEKKRKS